MNRSVWLLVFLVLALFGFYASGQTVTNPLTRGALQGGNFTLAGSWQFDGPTLVPTCAADPPVGACTTRDMCIDDANDALYVCVATVWTQIGGGGDAVTLGGLPPTSFLRSNDSDSYDSGTLTFASGANLAFAGDGRTVTWGTTDDGGINTFVLKGTSVGSGSVEWKLQDSGGIPESFSVLIDNDLVTSHVTVNATSPDGIDFTPEIDANGGISCTDCIALGTETSGSYAASTGEAGPATSVALQAGTGTTVSFTGYDVAELPAAGSSGRTVWIVDGQHGADCTAGGGATVVQCFDDGAAWVGLAKLAAAFDPPDAAANPNELGLYRNTANGCGRLMARDASGVYCLAGACPPECLE